MQLPIWGSSSVALAHPTIIKSYISSSHPHSSALEKYNTVYDSNKDFAAFLLFHSSPAKLFWPKLPSSPKQIMPHGFFHCEAKMAMLKLTVLPSRTCKQLLRSSYHEQANEKTRKMFSKLTCGSVVFCYLCSSL